MIAKLIVYGEDRPVAITRLRDALEQCAIFGVKTNTPLLHSIATHPAFQTGLTHTSFLIEHHLMDTPATAQPAIPRDALTAAAFSDSIGSTDAHYANNGHAPQQANRNPWQALGPWRMIGEVRQVWYTYQDNEYRVAIRTTADNKDVWNVQVEGEAAEPVSCVFGNDGLILLRRGAVQTRAYVQRTDEETHVALCGRIYRLARRHAPTVEATSRGKANPGKVQKTLAAPMAGTIVKVNVHDGDSVEQRQTLVILSAMKMEHTIAAPYDGKVRHVFYQEGAVVPGGAVIVEME